MKKSLLGIEINNKSKTDILEQIKKSLLLQNQFCHIVSLNPENVILAQTNKEFKKTIETAQIKIVDGVGIVLAAQMLGIPIRERLTGVDLMEDLMVLVRKSRLTVLLIGGRGDLALSLSKCYQERFPKAKFFGIEGFKNIYRQTKNEEEKIMSIVRHYKPHLIFAAFGSPEQELWLARHKRQFKGIVCMGVGQGFDVVGGIVNRAPVWLRKIGLEWLYRLMIQPWRWKRQLRLIKFIWLMMKERFI